MVSVAEHTLKEVDVILWLVEPSEYIGEGDQAILERLKRVKTPVILVVNKIDTVEKAKAAAAIQAFSKQYKFKDVIAVSALKDQNTDVLIKEIAKLLPEGPMYYDEDTVTDQPMRQIVAEIIREKALRLLRDEIPHGIAVTTDIMKERKNGLYDIEASIICERENHKGMIIGRSGSMLKKIGTQARSDIELLVGSQVNLKLWVKVRKEWRDSNTLLRNYGYKENQ
jgi:GTP-binding protein Era